ncbi:hypothetical protein L6218_08825 [Pseudomonas syringae pv. syringae]|nr:hypothetical protein [Pseudomonas syringae]KPB20856.1 Uncharacterized protein AC518_3066 [Pseudomonas syringae pv. syringae]MCF5181640.1 hypothetical protein [Pseudomonas syringae]MCF5312185.1 hypothetical protein [Pseudomonas syringae]MCF5391292.1 hypothetical protein [Pseudomonas syringae]MCF5394855.1 hypothetical protein [Pseudomonas syringae]
MKIAIVSTYKIECGIARFSEILEKNLSMTDNVTVFELPRHELKLSFGATKEGSDRFVETLCEQLKSFDAVSVQCEYSLFSDDIRVSVERIKKILSSNKNSTLTLHTVINRSTSADTDMPSLFRWMTSPKSAFRTLLHSLRSTRAAKAELHLFEYVKKNNIKIIVHTETTKEILSQRFRLSNVHCHPLCYTSESEKNQFIYEDCRQELLDKLVLEKDVKLIGVFGFFGHYKGFDYAIQCIDRMPKNYKLLIFSGLHPNLIKNSDSSQIEYLLNMAKKLKVLDRVFFMGSVDDRSLYRAIAGVDCSWLPYREVGQEASAICSEVSELSRRVIVSRNFAFIDYMKFGLRKQYQFFEIGNIEELKLKTVFYDRFFPEPSRSDGVVNHAELQATFYKKVVEYVPVGIAQHQANAKVA